MNALQRHLQKAGRIGGKSTSDRKRKAALANLKRANQVRLGKGGKKK